MRLADYLKTSSKTHLIFDFDETLVKLLLPWEDAIKGAEKELAVMDKNLYDSYRVETSSLSYLQNDFVRKFGKKALDILIKTEIEFEAKNLKDAIPNQELIDFVKNLSGCKLFIWSSNTKSTLEKLLKSHGILEKFEKIVAREDVEFLKPEIDGFKLLYDPKIPKENYLFVGDSKADKTVAEKVGIDFYPVDFFSAGKNIGN